MECSAAHCSVVPPQCCVDYALRVCAKPISYHRGQGCDHSYLAQSHEINFSELALGFFC